MRFQIPPALSVDEKHLLRFQSKIQIPQRKCGRGLEDEMGIKYWSLN